MEHHTRSLRSKTSTTTPSPVPPPPSSPLSFTTRAESPVSPPIKLIPPNTTLPNLTPTKLSLLRRKQRKLASTAATTVASLPPNLHLLNGLSSTLIFAQHEAGTAICIDASGCVLTCAHCFGDDEDEYRHDSKQRWMLFYTGLAVQVECRVWDAKRDLALLRIVAVETDRAPPSGGEVPTFCSVGLAPSTLEMGAGMVCIGQPGCDDLESAAARKTRYNLVEISEGNFRGMVSGQDPNDNEKIGSLMHDAWTYWGHSGAPLLLRGGEGGLVGLHSSWDESTGMRHGVPGVSIGAFLGKWLDNVGRAERLMEPAVTEFSSEDGREVGERSPWGEVEGDDRGRCGSREVVVIEESE